MDFDDGLHLTPEERWREVVALQNEYKSFPEFLYDVVTGLMGFSCTRLQLDIAMYLQFGPTYRMVQAQRGQAKTTITAAYAVWRIIHDPSTRVLVVSSGDTMATEIANWVIQIIMGMDELRCLRPDKAMGDRASVKAFDVHHVLKGAEKSPSVACMGITSNMQGKRADVLIADDIESSKNSATEVQRERLKHLTRDFTSICSTGDIIYLGTPQSIDSVYNGLVGRGFDIRIWSGRYPTTEEEENYGGLLAPIITEAMKKDPTLRTGGGPLGDRGKPTDPVLLDEDVLTKKEIDQGRAYFQLQHMLDTRLMDKDRFPLKISNIMFLNFGSERAPITVDTVRTPDNRLFTPSEFPVADMLYRVSSTSAEYGAFQGTHMHVDPAGGGRISKDETGYGITSFMAGKIFARAAGGITGGYELENLEYLAEIAKKYNVTSVSVEKNMGNGAFWHIWQPVLLKAHPVGVEEVWESGQKELRIIDVLEPVLSAGRLVMHEDLIKQDMHYCEKWPVQDRPSYSLFYQMARITRDRNSLLHDDRLDAFAGSVRFWVEHLKQDEEKAKAAARKKQYENMMKDPLGNGRPVKGYNTMRGIGGSGMNALSRRKGRR